MNTGGLVLWRELLDEATERLAEAGLDSADIEARRIVVAAAGCDDTAWHRELDRPATRRGVASFDSMLARRIAGEPLQY
ncbi:MAG: peptide chain release factor N(5)-glutamine methyltransferase, partial [Acidimicrobiia bacterium]|nr:peptide chain release factor N(5)-glutamine methyltransferase [Acidimicrobiia bacterium]